MNKFCSGVNCQVPLRSNWPHRYCCNELQLYCDGCAISSVCRSCGGSISNTLMKMVCCQCASENELYHCRCGILCWECLYDPFTRAMKCDACNSVWEPLSSFKETSTKEYISVSKTFKESQVNKCTRCLREEEVSNMFSCKCKHLICKRCLASPRLQLKCPVVACNSTISKNELWEFKQSQKRRSIEDSSRRGDSLKKKHVNQHSKFGEQLEFDNNRSQFKPPIKTIAEAVDAERRGSTKKCTLKIPSRSQILLDQLPARPHSRRSAKEIYEETSRLRQENNRLRRLLEALQAEKKQIQQLFSAVCSEKEELRWQLSNLNAQLDSERRANADYRAKQQAQVRQLQYDLIEIRKAAMKSEDVGKFVASNKSQTVPSLRITEDTKCNMREATCQTEEFLEPQKSFISENHSLRFELEMLREELTSVKQSVRKIERQSSHREKERSPSYSREEGDRTARFRHLP